MILALDVGNTNIHLGLFDGSSLLDQWRFATGSAMTADELGLLVDQFIRSGGFSFSKINGVAVACVVPPMYSIIREGLSRYVDLGIFFVDPERHDTLPILYDKPGDVGADRLANTIAGIDLEGCPLVVVDFGTATTFDVVSADGEYLGGAIAPGIEISIGALFSRASRLPRVDLVAPGRAVGKTTSESMQSGIIYGYAGLVDHLIELIWKELGAESGVIATGGLAKTIAPYTKTVHRIEPTLTLEGILKIFMKNRDGMDNVEG